MGYASSKVHVISDEKLGGVKREYVEVDNGLEPTDIVVIDGERFRMVDRKAEVGERVLYRDKGKVETVVCTIDVRNMQGVGTPSFTLYDNEYYVLEPIENDDKSVEKFDKQLDHTANLALRVVQLERAVKQLSDMAIKHGADIHRLKNETEYLDETWRQTREIQLGLSDDIRSMSDELEAIKCEK